MARNAVLKVTVKVALASKLTDSCDPDRSRVLLPICMYSQGLVLMVLSVFLLVLKQTTGSDGADTKKTPVFSPVNTPS